MIIYKFVIIMKTKAENCYVDLIKTLKFQRMRQLLMRFSRNYDALGRKPVDA